MTNPEHETGDGGWADVGPLPAAPGCTCQICIPDAAYDEDQRNTIETVNREGWEVIVIDVQDESGERVLACTVGLGTGWAIPNWCCPACRTTSCGRQPSQWRVPVAHVGAFAPDPEWTFQAPPEQLVVACNHIVEQGAAVCFVQRQNVNGKGEQWSFHCGELHGGAADYALTHVSHIVRATPSLREVTGIRPGEYVWRDGPDGRWRRTSHGEYHPLENYPLTG